jgi:ribosome-associated protein
MKEIKVDTDIIKLDAFLKWSGIASQGSDAKFYIKNGDIKLNDEVEVQRGKKLVKGDIVEFNGESYKVV